MRMDINALDVPRSTLIVAGALWAFSTALVSWNLIATLNIKDQQASDNRATSVALAETNGRVTALEKHDDLTDRRLDKLETRR